MLDKPWGGRFKEKTDKFFEEFTESLSFDWILAKAEIKASLAYAKALYKIKNSISRGALSHLKRVGRNKK